MYNQNQAVNPQNFVKTTVIIHLALFMGQVLFAAVCLFISVNPVINLKTLNDPFFYVSPALVIFGIFMGSFLFKRLHAKVAEKPTLKEKLSAYQAALIIRYAFSEGASFFGIVCMLLTNNAYYLIVVSINIIYFIIIRPTKFKIQDDLNLSYEENSALEG